jgi:hypothetical protein
MPPNYPVVNDIINPTKAKKRSTPIISPHACSSPSGLENASPIKPDKYSLRE